MVSLLGGIFMGWALGANDASNIFGAAVGARMVKFWTATLLAGGFVLLGAVISGQAGIATLQGLTSFELSQAVIASVAAALSVSLMTLAGWPVSTSQAVVGAIIGVGIMNNQLNISGLGKVVTCWLTTPIGGAVIAFVLYKICAFFYNRMKISIFTSDRLMKICFVIFGSYGAYALGANNVANVTAVFVGAGKLTVFQAALIGGASIALGILTFSKHVMETVGSKLIKLDPFSALMVSISLGFTIHLYTLIGVPVSSSQAIIGSLLGIGIIKGTNTVSRSTLMGIFLAWFLTPVIACALALGLFFVTHLKYVGP